jgi:thymidylate synthase
MTKPHPMQQFHDLVANIRDNGSYKGNRTGVGTHFLPNQMLTFDLADGFPAITTKKLAFKSAIGELIGFFRGFTSAAQFREIGCPVWTQNANETSSWLASPYRQGEDDCGRIYGAQFTDWRDWKDVHSQEDADALIAKGYSLMAHDESRNTWILRRGINQLEQCLHTLLTNPNDRRMLVTAWRPDEFDSMCLPPCHLSYSLVCDTEKRELHLLVHMRSFDTFLAFNVALAALWLSIYAKMAGYTPRLASLAVSDAHIYTFHQEQVETLLSREHYPQPTLELGQSIEVIQSVDQIKGAFERIQPKDINLLGYVHHPAIKAPMAA